MASRRSEPRTCGADPPAARPGWQNTALALPEEERCYSQKVIISSLSQIEHATHTFLYCPHVDKEDIYNLAIAGGLASLVEVVSLNGGFNCLRYYCTENEFRRMLRVVMRICLRLIDGCWLPEPAGIIPIWFAAILVGGMRLFDAAEDYSTPEEAQARQEFAAKTLKYLIDQSPSMIQQNCDKYLKETLASALTTQRVVNLLGLTETSLSCDLCSTGIQKYSSLVASASGYRLLSKRLSQTTLCSTGWSNYFMQYW